MFDLAPGTVLGQYTVVRTLGHGASATVYLARQQPLDREVAIKVLAPIQAGDEQMLARFRREAQAVSWLRHPNILTIHDFGSVGEVNFMVTEALPGGTLAARLGGPLPIERAREIGAALARALDTAHARGVVHRDVKPANVLFTADDVPVLSDFGVAQILERHEYLTATGSLVGTPRYMSPEQAAGRVAEPASDLYALGVLLYEMLSGRPPFEADTPVALVRAHLYDAPPPIRTIDPTLPPTLDALFVRILAKDPAQRHASGAELVAALDRALADGDASSGAVVDLENRATLQVPFDSLQRLSPAPGPPSPDAPTSLRVPVEPVAPHIRPATSAVGNPDADVPPWPPRMAPPGLPPAGVQARNGGPLVPVAILVAVGAVFVALFFGARQLMVGTVAPTAVPFEDRATATPRPVGSPGVAEPPPRGAPGAGLTSPVPPVAGAPSPDSRGAAPPAASARPAPAPSPGNDVVPPPASAPVSAPAPTAGPSEPDPSQGPLFVGILAPVNGDRVPARPVIRGVRRGLQGPDEHVWLLIHPQGPSDLWWPHSREIIADRDGAWEITDLQIGGPAGLQHELVVGVVDADGNQRVLDEVVKRPGQPFTGMPAGFRVLAKITVVKAG